MIDRENYHIAKHGYDYLDEVATSATLSWVGGSPVTLSANGVIGINTAAEFMSKYYGIAWHSKYQADKIGIATILYSPGYCRIKQGTEDAWSGTGTQADPVKPYYTSTTFAIGDLLRPAAITSGGIDYSAWTNDVWDDTSSGQTTGDTVTMPFFAKVLSVEGTAGDPDSLVIEFSGPYFKYVTIA